MFPEETLAEARKMEADWDTPCDVMDSQAGGFYSDEEDKW